MRSLAPKLYFSMILNAESAYKKTCIPMKAIVYARSFAFIVSNKIRPSLSSVDEVHEYKNIRQSNQR